MRRPLNAPAPTLLPPLHCCLYAAGAALINSAFGYDVGVISGSLSEMAAALHLSTVQQEIATSGLNFVAGLGALVSGSVLDTIGRRRTLLLASASLLLGGIVVSSAGSFSMLLFGRALQGLGSGCGWCACTVCAHLRL